MSILSNLFSKATKPLNYENSSNENINKEIPEDVFIEKNENGSQKKDKENERVVNYNIDFLYDFLSTDFQQQGYNDALVNPDTSYMRQNIDSIISDLEMNVRRVLTFYEDAIKELDFLIESRSRLGMVDVVDEFKMKKDKAFRHVDKVNEMQAELIGEKKESHRVTISYKRGFHNGMAAIAHHESNKRTF